MYHKLFPGRKRWAAWTMALTLVLSATAQAQSDPIKCRQTVAAASAKYELARAGALKKCEDAVRKGKLPPSTTCPDGDAKTVTKIAGAQSKLDAAIAKACCGDDKACGAGSGADADLALSAIGWSGRVAACSDGERDGLSCQSNADCPGVCLDGTREGLGVECASEVATTSLCPSGCLGTCVGGSNGGNECSADSDCPSSTCGSKVCQGGTNDGNACTTLANCPGNNFCEQSNGCGFGGAVADACPNLESQSCNNTLADPSDIATCVGCAGDVAADQVNDFIYGFLNPVDAAIEGADKCKATIVKTASKYFSTHRKALGKCQKGAIADSLPAGTCPDVDTTAKLAAAKTKMLDAIAGECGGADEAFGGGDDLAIEAVGAPLSCAGVTVPGGSACGGFLTSMQDVADCLTCVAEYKSVCNDFLGAPSNGAHPSACNQLCGNGKIESGETCDDGNVVDGDACPANCSISACAVSGSATASVSFAVPAGASVAGLTVYLDYPESAVQVPGQGSQAAVQNAIANTPSNTVFTPNDLNYALRVVLTENDNMEIAAGALLDVSLNRCNSQPLPAASAFNCRVESASSTTPGTNVFGTTCTVTSVF